MSVHQPAADAELLGSDTSRTTSAAARFAAYLVMSAGATIPQQALPASTTGNRSRTGPKRAFTHPINSLAKDLHPCPLL